MIGNKRVIIFDRKTGMSRTFKIGPTWLMIAAFMFFQLFIMAATFFAAGWFNFGKFNFLEQIFEVTISIASNEKYVAIALILITGMLHIFAQRKQDLLSKTFWNATDYFWVLTAMGSLFALVSHNRHIIDPKSTASASEVAVISVLSLGMAFSLKITQISTEVFGWYKENSENTPKNKYTVMSTEGVINERIIFLVFGAILGSILMVAYSD